AVALGEYLFGENRVQELVPKHDELTELPITWHFIGHLQTNKVKDVIGRATCVQSVDRTSLVEALHQECIKKQTSIDVMIEVNTSFEESKHGLHPNDVPAFVDLIAPYATLRVVGFMTIGANVEDEATVRNGFAMLREIRDKHLSILPLANSLSMGMSHDLEWAIAEGSTLVRVGSAVFGNRG
ncbi:MAG: YggS family pyridoxal phosphate-dependent enzyme, partial [Ignavibacteria bacterium]